MSEEEPAGEEIAETPEAVERQAVAVTKEVSAEAEEPSEVRVHEDHTREMKTPGFARMRTEWHGPERAQVEALRQVAEGFILRNFTSAYVIMNDLFAVVREPLVDQGTGEVLTDIHGWPVWAKTAEGSYVEDYSRLGTREREDFLFRITTNLFDWQQVAAELWGNAMFAKAMWEEAFSHGYVEGTGKLTIEDRTQRARQASIDERYFAIFQTLLSRRADAIVRTMELLGQRLKDVL